MLVATDRGIYNVYIPMIVCNAKTGENNIDEVCKELDRQIKDIAAHESSVCGISVDIHA